MTVSAEGRSGKPLLATQAGRYREYVPPPALQPHFRCLWTHELQTSSPVAIVPDGCCDLLFTGNQILVAGPDRTAAFPSFTRGTRITGARFAPGAAASWLGMPLCEITGLSVPLRDLAPGKAALIEAELGHCPEASSQLNHLALRLTKLAEHEVPPETQAGLIFAAASAGAEQVRELQKMLGIGERQLRRRALQHFGYGVKTLERIGRLQRFMRLCRGNDGAPLAMLAADAGFSDQAHMTREIRDLTTLTPAAMFEQLAVS